MISYYYDVENLIGNSCSVGKKKRAVIIGAVDWKRVVKEKKRALWIVKGKKFI